LLNKRLFCNRSRIAAGRGKKAKIDFCGSSYEIKGKSITAEDAELKKAEFAGDIPNCPGSGETWNSSRLMPFSSRIRQRCLPSFTSEMAS
jgi:hypothetical protein